MASVNETTLCLPPPQVAFGVETDKSFLPVMTSRLCMLHFVRHGVKLVPKLEYPDAWTELWAEWRVRSGYVDQLVSVWLCPQCWSACTYAELVAEFGEPVEIRAPHPGPLPTELESRCVPRGTELDEVNWSVEPLASMKRAAFTRFAQLADPAASVEDAGIAYARARRELPPIGSGRCILHLQRDKVEVWRDPSEAPADGAGWATWLVIDADGRPGAGYGLCPDCWTTSGFEELVQWLGPPVSVEAMHPGPLPSHLEYICLPAGMEHLRRYDSDADLETGRTTRDVERATRSLWNEAPLAQLRIEVLKRYATRVAGQLAASRASQPEQTAVTRRDADAPQVRAAGRTTAAYASTSDEVVRLYPGVRLVRELGRGAFSTVYEVVREEDNLPCALKLLSRKAVTEPVIRERFRREADILGRLDHPNLVRLYEVADVTGVMAFLMEFVAGGATLRAVIQKGKVAPRRALEIAEGICAGLDHAHRQGIVHRDIKPDNIILNREGVPKIADFGIAKILRETLQGAALTVDSDLIGTPSYMAPEQVAAPLEIDGRVDIFGLGVTLYEMLTGKRPVVTRSGSPLRVAPVDPRVDEILRRAMAFEPEHRYRNAYAFLADLSAARLGFE